MDSRRLQQKDLSQEEFPRTWSLLLSGVADGVAPGMVAGLWLASDPDSIRIAATGRRRLVPSPLPMLPETIFDLASVTKVFSTATLTALLVQRGWLRWDTPLRAILPSASSSEIQIRHLLSHTAGLPAWAPLWQELRDRFAPRRLERVSISERQRTMRNLVLQIQPEARPGTKTVYSDISFLLLGFAIEEVTQMPLDRAVKKFLWEPLGIRDAFYRRVDRSASRAAIESVAATEQCPWRGAVLQGQVHDDNTWAMGGYAGHAGAFGTARDVLHFSRALFSGFLSLEVLKAMWTRVSEPAGCERTLGWDTPSGPEPAASQRFSQNSVGHLGFTGTSLWIDPEAGLAVTLLTNRVHPSRENAKIKAFRPRFHETIRQDLSSPGFASR